MQTQAAVKVLIVEDHPVVRLGLRQLLIHGGIQAIEEASSIEGALASLGTSHPDLIIADLSLGGGDGLEFVQHVREMAPGIPILIFSMFDDLAHVVRALKAGARAYVTKGEANEWMTEAIRACLAGEVYFSPKIKQLLDDSTPLRGGMGSLSLQEQMVYSLLGQGLTSSAIAARMDLSPRTVESYYLRIQIKLGLDGMKALRRQAISHPI